jgi:hypothetical protein
VAAIPRLGNATKTKPMKSAGMLYISMSSGRTMPPLLGPQSSKAKSGDGFEAGEALNGLAILALDQNRLGSDTTSTFGITRTAPEFSSFVF